MTAHTKPDGNGEGGPFDALVSIVAATFRVAEAQLGAHQIVRAVSQAFDQEAKRQHTAGVYTRSSIYEEAAAMLDWTP